MTFSLPWKDSVLSGDSEEAVRQALAELEYSEALAERRREKWGDCHTEAMTKLARMFPALRQAQGIEPWDALKLLQWACRGVSHGELLAAKFCLMVWNRRANWEFEAREHGLIQPDGRFSEFDIFEAWGVWDHGNRNAALEWLQCPFWP